MMMCRSSSRRRRLHRCSNCRIRRIRMSMQLTWRRSRRTLRWPFETAHGRRDYQETVIASLEHEGITGLGEACPSSLYGHTLETIEAALPRMAARIASVSPFHIEHILDDLVDEFDTQRSAVAAIDMALHD